MGHLRQDWWRWVRGLLAALLGYLVIALFVMHSGRIVFDTSVTPPTHQIVGRLPGILVGAVATAFALSCIFVSMWKRWDFEIVGWLLLLVFIFGGIGH